MFDPDASKADIYFCFDRILQMGIKHLYMDTKDISELKAARMRRAEAADRNELFQSSAVKAKEQKQFRRELEQAYEREKSKSVISKRCSRIYEEHLKRLEPHLYSHLMANEVAPELHLTRWLRCMMSREFSLETSLKIWDFIFSGIEEGMIASFNAQAPESTSLDYDTLLKEPQVDPFIGLECLSVAMIALIKAELLESDFSMCLGLLMSYKEPDQPACVLE